jgi:hypothetical protein
MSDSEIGLPGDDPRVLAIVSSSILVRTLTRVVNVALHAFETSAIAARGRALAADWAAAEWQGRRRAAGLAVLVAVPVHVALSLWQGVPPGWLWLMAPACAAVFGLFLLAASGPFGPSR